MIRLEESKILKRRIRQDDLTDLAIPTWTLVREAIQAKNTDKALDFLNYGWTESRSMHDTLVSFTEMAVNYIASSGEEELEKFFRQRYYPAAKDWLAITPGVVESLQRCAEYDRAHYGESSVIEEPDRYVLRKDPCGSGGRLRRTRSVGTTKKAYPWSWSKSGVPYYCTHCCFFWEIIPIELRGYPIRISIPGNKPEDPCINYFYKKPELIPEEYFKLIGKTKKVK